jgi:hypothetical protein
LGAPIKEEEKLWGLQNSDNQQQLVGLLARRLLASWLAVGMDNGVLTTSLFFLFHLVWFICHRCFCFSHAPPPPEKFRSLFLCVSISIIGLSSTLASSYLAH